MYFSLWNYETNNLEDDYLLIYCNNPYNIICYDNKPIRLYKDIIENNRMLSELHYIILDIIEALEHLSLYTDDLYLILSSSNYNTFIKYIFFLII